MKNLAYNKRPKSFQDFVGQSHLFGGNAPLMRLILSGKIPHSFFFGPPGSGKTSAAILIARAIDSPFYSLNATSFKSEELRAILKNYQNTLQKPLIFIDEVHRLNKTQQEMLLPIMENYQALILGASTENPYSALTQAIRSRSMVFEFYPLEKGFRRDFKTLCTKHRNSRFFNSNKWRRCKGNAESARLCLKHGFALKCGAIRNFPQNKFKRNE